MRHLVLVIATVAAIAVHPDLEHVKFGGPNASAQFTLYKFPAATYPEAVCLDGTQAGIYFQPGFGPDANKFMFYFQGGGWCYSLADCVGRSKGNLGSSTNWAATGSMGGMLSMDQTTNPYFAGWTKVWLGYCDGNSFSGMQSGPVNASGTPLYFKGRYIIDAALDMISKTALPGAPGLFTKAARVVTTGCSAGGLATYLHADYVGAYVAANLPAGTPYAAISISGFFLQSSTVIGEPIYADQIKTIHYLSNATAGVNAACVAAQSAGYEWVCNMASNIYPYITSPFFALNSHTDSWQTECVWTSLPVPAGSSQNGICGGVAGWGPCQGNPSTGCSSDQSYRLVQYGHRFLNDLQETATATRAANGGFIVSCHTHCEAQNDGPWTTFAIGGVVMRDAVTMWMGNATQPKAPAWYTDCDYKLGTVANRQCNPSCGSS